MVQNATYPDYELDDRRVVSSPAQLKALAHPIRAAVLDMLLERAASITELSAALGRPKSTVAHHVAMLVEAGMVVVIRTRRVRAIDERFYGRTARLFAVGALEPSDIDPVPWPHPLADAVRESQKAYRADTMWANLRHARIPRSAAAQFWSRIEELMVEFSELPRDGDEVFGFSAALYPSEFPALGTPADDQGA